MSDPYGISQLRFPPSEIITRQGVWHQRFVIRKSHPQLYWRPYHQVQCFDWRGAIGRNSCHLYSKKNNCLQTFGTGEIPHDFQIDITVGLGHQHHCHIIEHFIKYKFDNTIWTRRLAIGCFPKLIWKVLVSYFYNWHVKLAFPVRNLTLWHGTRPITITRKLLTLYWLCGFHITLYYSLDIPERIPINIHLFVHVWQSTYCPVTGTYMFAKQHFFSRFCTATLIWNVIGNNCCKVNTNHHDNFLGLFEQHF